MAEKQQMEDSQLKELAEFLTHSKPEVRDIELWLFYQKVIKVGKSKWNSCRYVE